MNALADVQRRSLGATEHPNVGQARSLLLSRASATRGVALLAWLGVLAVIAILLAFLLPALIRETDFQVARGESATLKTLGNALQSAIVHQSYIPSAAQTDWASLVSAETGMAIASITTNRRNQPRVLLIDTNGWFTTVGLPYSQPSVGTTNLPLNTRMMIATSLGQPLPISGGPLSASSFSNLWNAAEGTLPAIAPWTTWNGQPGDVKLERINLLPLFITLRLASYPASTTNIGYYGVGNNNNVYPALALNNQSPAPPSYYLQDTVLRLYGVVYQPSPSVHLDSTQVLNQDASFIYDSTEGVWRSSAVGGAMPGGVDISGIVYAFLNSVPNLNAQYGADQQRLVALSMMNYMSNYIVWANGNFTDNTLKTYLKGTVQPNMMGTVQNLFMSPYYPANAGPCQ